MMSSGRRTHEDVEAVDLGVDGRAQRRFQGANALEFPNGSLQFAVGGYPLTDAQPHQVDQMRLRLLLRVRQPQLCLQAAQFEIGIGRFRGNRNAYRRLTDFGRLGVGARGLASTAQRTEQIDFPGCLRAGRIGLVIARGSNRVGHFTDRRCQGIMRTRRRSSEASLRQQRRAGQRRGGPRLGHSRRRRRQIEILRQRAVDDLRQHRVVESRPPNRIR